jgi:hypothetical protein
MVGLRPYKAASQILPEQTLGRGLRPMFRGQPVTEKVSVVGTDAFMEFVESIRSAVDIGWMRNLTVGVWRRLPTRRGLKAPGSGMLYFSARVQKAKV